MEIAHALRRYVEQLHANGAADSTRAQVERQIGKMARWLATERRVTDVATVAPDDIAAFLASDAVRKRETGGARKTSAANVYRSTIRTFFRFVADAGLAPSNAGRLVKLARCPPPRPKPVSDADIAKLMTALDGALTWSEHRDRALFKTMLATGIRLSNAIDLEVEDVNLDDASITLRHLKGGGEDIVYLAPDTVELLRAHLAGRTSGPVFAAPHGGKLAANSVRARLALWGRRAGVEELHPHRLRHTRGSALYAATGDLWLVSRSLTHRSIASTVTYAHLDASRLRKAAASG